MKRELEIDAARGFMLVWMTLTHLPTVLTPWVNQPLGYISASEGFIFLSALFTGRIYYRLLARDSLHKMTTKLLLRTLRLYGYHVLLLLIAFGIAARYAMGIHGQGLYNLLDYYFAAGPSHAVVSALLLLYRPPLLDIVPLYIIFLLLSPLAIYIAVRIGWKFMLSMSAALWFFAQFGLREASYAFLAHHFGLQIPLNEMGAFNLWAWQLVWVVGMWCGVRWARNDLPVQEWARRTWIPAAFIVVVFVTLRYLQIFGLDLGWYSVFFDKWPLGFARLIDFTALAMVLIRFRPVARLFAVRPVVLMGQSSLHVFCTHFVFCFIGIGMLGEADRLYGWKQAALVVVTFSALLLIARLNARPISGLGSSAQRAQRSAPASPRPQAHAQELSSQAGRP